MSKLAFNPWITIGASLACSGPSSDPAPDFEQGPGTGSSSVAATAGRSSTSNASGSTPTPFGFFDESGSEVVITPGNSCGGAIFEPEQLPLDMYFLVDSSGSMAEPTALGQNKWDLVTSALINFLGDPDNDGIGVGIGYFPEAAAPTCAAGDPGCLCIPVINLCLSDVGGSCAPADYAAPAVPLALPPAPARVIGDLQGRAFAGGTPTRAALEGTYRYLEGWASQNPGRRVVAVLATDGEPTGCSGNTAADAADLAASARAGDHHIQTFVIGVGRALANLNQVAQAGGTTQAYLTDTSSNLGVELGAALSAIRTSAGPCVFEIPSATEQGVVDPNLVNVRVTPSGASAPTVVAKTFGGTAEGCGPQGGWHYDDPAAPTRIQLCEASCSVAFNARLEVQFGCETVIQTPR